MGEREMKSWGDFFDLVRDMRAAQVQYFEEKKSEDLFRAKDLERLVDRFCVEHEIERRRNNGR
jgi:hypothetical protein